MATTPLRRPESQLFPPPSRAKTNFRVILLAVVTGYYGQKLFRDQLLPFGPPVMRSSSPSFAKIDYNNDNLMLKHGKTRKIYQHRSQHDGGDSNHDGLIKGPETVVFSPDGSMFLLTEDANLLLVNPIPNDNDNTKQQQQQDPYQIQASVTLIKNLGVGRPLGASFTKDGKYLYIADTLLGLTRLPKPLDSSKKSKVELVVSTVMDGGVMTPIRYADDVVVGPKTGKVYFTDASDVVPDRLLYKNSWDTLYASKVDLLRNRATGRILCFDPATDETTVLAKGLKFANGISVDKNESYLIFAETFGVNILKYHLTGPLQGTIDVVVPSEKLTGYVDGVDCSQTTGKCYAAIPSAIVPLHTLLLFLPRTIDHLLRTLLLTLPRKIAPKVKPYGGFIEFDPNGDNLKYYQDPTGKDLGMFTGVTVKGNSVYLGSLENDFVAVYDLN